MTVRRSVGDREAPRHRHEQRVQAIAAQSQRVPDDAPVDWGRHSPTSTDKGVDTQPGGSKSPAAARKNAISPRQLKLPWAVGDSPASGRAAQIASDRETASTPIRRELTQARPGLTNPAKISLQCRQA